MKSLCWTKLKRKLSLSEDLPDEETFQDVERKVKSNALCFITLLFPFKYNILFIIFISSSSGELCLLND